jgi:hypothetical protein
VDSIREKCECASLRDEVRGGRIDYLLLKMIYPISHTNETSLLQCQSLQLECGRLRDTADDIRADRDRARSEIASVAPGVFFLVFFCVEKC